MRFRASGAARLQVVPALYACLFPAFLCVVHRSYERATPDARERIPTATRADRAGSAVPGGPCQGERIGLFLSTTDRAPPPGVVRAVCKSHTAPESFSRIAP